MDAPATASAEVVEEAEGIGVEGGIAIATFLILVVAFLFLDHVLGSNYDKGLLF